MQISGPRWRQDVRRSFDGAAAAAAAESLWATRERKSDVSFSSAAEPR